MSLLKRIRTKQFLAAAVSLACALPAAAANFEFRMPSKGVVASANGATASDPSFSKVSLLMHMEGANNGLVFTDVKGHPVTGGGAATTSTALKKAGASSLRIPNAPGAYLTTSASPDFTMGTGDFTVEMFVSLETAFTSGAQWLIGDAASNGLDIGRFGSGMMAVYLGGTGYAFGNWTPAPNQFYHVAISRNAGNLRLFIDGVQSGTTQAAPNNITTTQLRIGAQFTGDTFLIGNIDELRVTKGEGRYTANFTPPQGAFPDN